MKINKVLILMCYVFLGIQLFSQNNPTIPGNKKILFLNSYHKGYEWSDKVTQGIEDTFKNKNIFLDVEYLDTKRSFSPDYKEHLLHLLEIKCNMHKYDLIIVSDNNAFDLVLDNREIFNNLPIVFCGINFIKRGTYEGKDITGINEDIEIVKNIELIRALHPNAEKIYIITDNTTTGKIIQNKVVNLKSNIKNIEIIPLFNKTMEEVTKFVNNLDTNNVVFFTNFALDSNNIYYDTAIATQFVTKNSVVPVYGAWNFQIDNGIVGGIVINGYDQGVEVSKIALEILNGKSANSIPIIYSSDKQLIFDYNALKRFDMTHKSLPKERLIINQPERYYSKNKELIILTTIITLILLSIIVILLLNILHLKKTQQQLIKSKNEIEIRLDQVSQ